MEIVRKVAEPEEATVLTRAQALTALADALGNPALDGPADYETLLLMEATRRILQLPLVEWQRNRVITSLPGARLTPVVSLARTLEKAQAGKIRSVYIGIQWAQDDSYTHDHSSQPRHALCVHKAVLDRVVQNRLFGQEDDADTEPSV